MPPPAADSDRAGTDIGIIRLPLEPNLVAPGSTLIRLPPTDAGVELDRRTTTEAAVRQDQSSAAAKIHPTAMTPGCIREQHVDAGREKVSRSTANRVDAGSDPAFPHHIAARGHKAEAHIDRRLNHDAAADVLRLHIGNPHIDAELVLGAAHGGRCPALSMGPRGERQRECRQSHPGQELPHTTTSSWGGENRHIVKNHSTFCQLGAPRNVDGPSASRLTGHRLWPTW